MTLKTLKSQRGAMFGLDARIALAIFGGLSVVAGAAIISAVTDTNVSALATEFDNVGKGYIHYVLENSTDTTTWDDLEGQYVSQISDDHPKYGVWALVEGQDDVAQFPDDDCSDDGGSYCAVWATVTLVPTDTVEALETQIDGTTSPGATNAAGNFRYGAASSGTHTVAYKLSRMLN